MTLILNQIFTNSKSGIVQITLPKPSGTSRNSTTATTIKGFLLNDPTIRVRNQWGSILPDDGSLNELIQMTGQQNLFSWVAASSAAWKASDPISVGLDFYLLSINKNSNIKSQAGSLMSLAALQTSGEGSSGLADDVAVNVHGGYRVDLLEGNKDIGINALLTNAFSSLSGDKEGTLKIKIGDQVILKNMLLEECSAEHSSVQVAEGIPLYIKISATFRMFRAPLVADLESIYGA